MVCRKKMKGGESLGIADREGGEEIGARLKGERMKDKS
jgi:hypothetical protein